MGFERCGTRPAATGFPGCLRAPFRAGSLAVFLRLFAAGGAFAALLTAGCGDREKNAPVWTDTRYEYAIGIRTGAHPMVWSDPDPRLAVNPVLTARDVTDVAAAFVADPFVIREPDGSWHMFFETLDAAAHRGVVSWAVSDDGFSWRYRQVVLREPFHLSFPNVFEDAGEYYMVVESYQDDSVRLYRADPFPTGWRFVKRLLRGEHVDNAIFPHDGRWWLMTSTRASDTLRLWHAPQAGGPWEEHPLSPLIEGNAHIARPGGRVIPWNGGLIRYPQDCWPMYGNAVHAFVIEKLTADEYRERPWDGNPILTGSGAGWNALGMHHIDPLPLNANHWMAVVDGVAWAQPDHRVDIAFENGARLLGFSLRPPRRKPGETVLLRFFWKDTAGIDEPSTAMFVHLRGEGFSFQADYMMAAGREMFERVIKVPDEASPGFYRIWVGLYDPAGGGRRQRASTRLPRRRNAVVLPVQLEVPAPGSRD